MRKQQLLVSICILVCSAGAGSLVHAQPAATGGSPPRSEVPGTDTPSDEAKKEASGHFRRGVELFQEGAFRAALVEFERAYEIAPDYRLLYNIGQARLQVQDYLGATQSFERYLTDGGAQIAAERRNEVETSLVALRERVARLSIHVNMAGAEIFVDDQRVGVAPLASTVSVNVGRHRVYARTPEGVEGERVVDVAGGDLVDVSIELVARAAPVVVAGSGLAAAPAEEPRSRKRRAAIGMWAVAGASLAAAVVAGVMAQGHANDLDDELAVKPPEGEADRRKVRDLRGSTQTWALATDVAAGTAIAAGVTGLVLWLVGGPKQSEKQAQAKPARLSWGIGPASARITGHF